MHLLLVGLNHETAPLDVRERVAWSSKGVMSALGRLKMDPAVREAAIVSTCNRTELYAMLSEPSAHPLVRLLEDGIADLSGHLYTYEGGDAARHLFRVASGLDSMIVGEGQVLSQVRSALQCATEASTLGGRLSALFRHAIETGRRARSETRIAQGAVSISNAAIQLARELFGDLNRHSALVLGAGETAELTLRLLSDAGVRSIVVANRTYSHAHALAESIGARAARFDQLAETMAGADIVITSTAAPHPILRRDFVSGVMRKRRGRPLFLIDIAVPRDVEAGVGDLENVFLYNLDDLRHVVDENLDARSAEMAEVERIIEEELARFLASWHSLSLGPVLGALQERLEEIRLAEMEKSGRRLSDLSESELEAVELLTRGILKRILKEPIAQLKSRGDSPEGALYLDVLRTLFAIPETGLGSVLPQRPDPDLSEPERADLERPEPEGRRAPEASPGSPPRAGEAEVAP